jgi:hypothetical protein
VNDGKMMREVGGKELFIVRIGGTLEKKRNG